jgi:hypothetical protein
MSLQHIPSEIQGEFAIDDSGKVGVTAAGIARLCDVSRSALSQLLERIRVKQVDAESLKTLAGKDLKDSGFGLTEVACLLAYYAFDAGRYKSEVAAKNLMKIPAEYHPQLSMSTTPKPAGKGVEKVVQERLSRNLDGKMEVLTPVGKIDILTSTEIIEVKVAASWKGALGQVIAYAYFYPSHQKLIHLYGAAHSDSKGYIEKICKASGVIVTWE